MQEYNGNYKFNKTCITDVHANKNFRFNFISVQSIKKYPLSTLSFFCGMGINY